MVEAARQNERSQFALAYLKRMAHSGLLMLHQSAGGQAYLNDGRTLIFDGSGICDVASCLRDSTHSSVLASLKSTWDSMHENHQLASSFNAAAFVDLTIFVGTARRFRRGLKKHCWSELATNLWQLLRWSLVNFISACLNHTARVLISTVTDIESRAIPSRKKRVTQKPRNSDGLVAQQVVAVGNYSKTKTVGSGGSQRNLEPLRRFYRGQRSQPAANSADKDPEPRRWMRRRVCELLAWKISSHVLSAGQQWIRR